MLIANKITDAATGAGIPNASLTVVDDGNSPMGVGTVADANGNFQLNSSLLDNDANFVLVSSIGYASAQFQPSYLGQYGGTLNALAETLPPVVITPSASAKPGGNSLPLLLGVGALLLVSVGGEKKKVAGIDTNTVLILGVVALGGFLLLQQNKPSTTTVIQQAPATNPVASDISAGANALPGIITAFSNF